MLPSHSEGVQQQTLKSIFCQPSTPVRTKKPQPSTPIRTNLQHDFDKEYQSPREPVEQPKIPQMKPQKEPQKEPEPDFENPESHQESNADIEETNTGKEVDINSPPWRYWRNHKPVKRFMDSDHSSLLFHRKIRLGVLNNSFLNSLY